MINIKEIKLKIKQLKKIKLSCRAGTEERIKLYREIKDLKLQLAKINIAIPEKEELIKQILKIKPEYIVLGLDLNKHSIQQLKYHLQKIKKDK